MRLQGTPKTVALRLVVGGKKVMTIETAHKEILDREEALRIVAEHFRETDSLLQEMVNYGTNLLPRAAVSGNKDLTDSIVIGVFLKHAVLLADSIQINLSQGAVLAAHLPLRGLYETFLYISWLLHKDTATRARHYHVFNLREQRRWAARTVTGTPEHSAFTSVVNSLSIKHDAAKWAELEKEAQRQIEELDVILISPANSAINGEFEALRNTKHDYDVEWFVPTGAKSLFHMASLLGYEAEYKMFYSNFSGVVHASSSRKHLLYDGKYIAMDSIRSFESVQMVYSFTISMCLRIYRAILKQYRPGEMTNFARKYRNEWRERAQSIKSVVYNTTIGPR